MSGKSMNEKTMQCHRFCFHEELVTGNRCLGIVFEGHLFRINLLRLTTKHFMVLPSIVKATDLAVVMPRNIAKIFAATGGWCPVP